MLAGFQPGKPNIHFFACQVQPRFLIMLPRAQRRLLEFFLRLLAVKVTFDGFFHHPVRRALARVSKALDASVQVVVYFDGSDVLAWFGSGCGHVVLLMRGAYLCTLHAQMQAGGRGLRCYALRPRAADLPSPPGNQGASCAVGGLSNCQIGVSSARAMRSMLESDTFQRDRSTAET